MSSEDVTLLHRLRLAREDFVGAMSADARPPHPASLRGLAELQLVIMATEAVIADRERRQFPHHLKSEAA